MVIEGILNAHKFKVAVVLEWRISNWPRDEGADWKTWELDVIGWRTDKNEKTATMEISTPKSSIAHGSNVMQSAVHIMCLYEVK